MPFLGLRRNVAVPTIVNPIYNFLIFLTVPVLSLYFLSIGVSQQWLGVLFSFFPLALILFSPIVGILSDHVGRKRVIYGGIVCSALSIAIYAWLPFVFLLPFARLLDGVGWAAVAFIMLAKIEDSASEGERGRVTGVFMSISYIGALLGPLAGSFLADYFSLRFPFILSFFGLLILLVWLYLWKSHKKPVLEKRDFNPISTLRMFLSVKKLRAMAFLGTSMHARMPVFKIFLPLFVIELGGGYKEIGWVFFAMGLMHLLQGWAGKVVDRRGSVSIIIISVLLSAVAYIAAGFSTSYLFLMVAMVAEALTISFWNISALTFMSEIGERKGFEGVVMGSYSSLSKIGHLVFGVLSGFIAVAFGIRSLFIITGALSVIVCLLVAPVLKKKETEEG